jgi:hypothetical protein
MGVLRQACHFCGKRKIRIRSLIIIGSPLVIDMKLFQKTAGTATGTTARTLEVEKPHQQSLMVQIPN